MSRESEYSGKVYIVTGAASGMGKAATHKLLSYGATVYACDWNSQALGVFRDHENIIISPLDVSDSRSCEELVQDIKDRQGRIDGLVNFAGVLKRTGILECTDDEFDYVMQVNVYGCFYMLRAVSRVMRQQGRGSIVNISSIWSDIGAKGVIAYCASKGAVSQLTRSAALDLAGSGVRVNEIRPGETNTPMLASERGNDFSQEQIQQKLKEIAETIPVGRLADPEEIADAALYLLSDRSAYMTGSHITVDGGYTAK